MEIKRMSFFQIMSVVTLWMVGAVLSTYWTWESSSSVLVTGFNLGTAKTQIRRSSSAFVSNRRSNTVTTPRLYESRDEKIGVPSSTAKVRVPVKGLLEHVRRIFCISDLHTDAVANLEWLEEACRPNKNDTDVIRPGRGDVLIVAGDISHEMPKLKRTLQVLQDELECHLCFIPGNHEAWVGGKVVATRNDNPEDPSSHMDHILHQQHDSSLSKLEAVAELCHQMGVHTTHQLVGTAHKYPSWIVPIQGWYDGTLSIPGCEDLCHGFQYWPWTDFARCQWTDDFPRSTDLSTARIPMGLVEYFATCNEGPIQEVSNYFRPDMDSTSVDNDDGNDGGVMMIRNNHTGLITFSHFLPNPQTLPDWKDFDSETFLRTEWLNHGAADISAKFAKVAGSKLIDEQIRTILPALSNSQQHVHVFGHSHRPKDFVYKGIRYVHNPLGKPRERDMSMVSPNVTFQLLWDCTGGGTANQNHTNQNSGHVPAGKQVIRYWEEQGGGRKALIQNAWLHRTARRKRAKRRKARLDYQISQESKGIVAPPPAQPVGNPQTQSPPNDILENEN